MPGWNRIGFDDSMWSRAELVEPPGGVLQSQMLEPMRIVEVRKPVKITNPKPGMYLVDMGQAFYGTVRLKVSGPAGTRVQMRSACNINPDGTLRARDNRTALSTDVYTLKGRAIETWSPRFRGQGYRYVEVTEFPGVPTVDNFQGLVIHTDFDEVGGFRCSQPTINRIYENIRWTQRAYIRSLSMEPDRDERQGWLGTQAKDFESNAYNFQMAPLLTKWLADIRLDQHPDGQIPDVSPTYWSLYKGGIVWPSNITILPELQYDFYGDRRGLEQNYQAMKRWMASVSRHLKPDFTVDHNRYGDWCDAYSMDGGRETGGTPRELISTAYYYNNCRIMVRVARLLNQPDDAKHFAQLGEKIKAGFNRRFFTPEENKYGTGTQTSYVLPLAFDMVDPERREAVAPTPEQVRIVTKIDELFSDVDAGVAALERAKAKLKRYRASVLKAAVEGRLTEQWRADNPDVEPASKLLERILQQRRKYWEEETLRKYQEKGKEPPKNWKSKYKEPAPVDTSTLPALPDSWCWARVDQVGHVQLGRQRSPKNRSKDYPTKYMRAANITEQGLHFADVLDMEFKPHELETYRLAAGDILVSEASGSPDQVGKPAVWNEQLPVCCFQNTVIRLRPSPVLGSSFLLTIFRHCYVNSVFARIAGGVGINHLSAAKFVNISIPLAPLAEQQVIVDEVDRRLTTIAVLENQIDANLARAARLRQSILKRAFEGKLVDQDPNDEPAATLLT